MKGTTTAGPGLYLHVPLCTAKCGYCDFYSVPAAGINADALVDRMILELTGRLASAAPGVPTIFVGGGTPTALAAPTLGRLLRPLAELAAEGGCREFTVEANPATVDEQKAAVLAASGVNRLSLGAQSFRPDELAVLERRHAPTDVAPSLEIARRAGIRHFNLDLIFGIPGQTPSSWAGSLEAAVELGAEHVSLYGLTYEPGTALSRRRDAGRITPCDEEAEAALYDLAVRRLSARGYEQYEISNFALPGRRCRHNVAYWRNDPYIGVGPSAAGYLDGVRYRNVADIAAYIRMIDDSGTAVVESEKLEGARLAGETAMLQLRLVEGIEVAAFTRRTGFDPGRLFAESIARYTRSGHLIADRHHIALTARGRLVADAVLADFLADADTPPASAAAGPAEGA